MRFTKDWFSYNIPNWRQWLKPLVGQPVDALELGVYEGRSAIWLLQNVLTNPASTIDLVDVWHDPAVEARFLENLKRCQTDKANVWKESSYKFLSGSLMEYDLIYVDADHRARAVLEDSVLAWRLLKSGGLMIWDDYQYQGDEGRPARAIEPFLDIYSDEMELVGKGYQVYVRKKVTIQPSEMALI
eukprot:Skav230498  [mRNA]  locus=C8948124:654:1211:+ [translate_table: standard]